VKHCRCRYPPKPWCTAELYFIHISLPAYSVYKYLSVLLLQGVFSVDKEVGLTLTEIADGIGVEDIIAATGCEFGVSSDLKPMVQVPDETEDV